VSRDPSGAGQCDFTRSETQPVASRPAAHRTDARPAFV